MVREYSFQQIIFKIYGCLSQLMIQKVTKFKANTSSKIIAREHMIVYKLR